MKTYDYGSASVGIEANMVKTVDIPLNKQLRCIHCDHLVEYHTNYGGCTWGMESKEFHNKITWYTRCACSLTLYDVVKQHERRKGILLQYTFDLL